MGKKIKESTHNEKLYEVFINGIPYSCEQQDIRVFLQSPEGITDIKMPRYQDTGRCRGYAHVKFDNQQDYDCALAKSGKNCKDRYLTVEPAKGQKQTVQEPTVPVGCRVLFAKNLPYEIKEQQLKSEFASCGVVRDVRMVRNWSNRKFKGFAYVEYRDLGSVKKAIAKYHNKVLRGRRLICDGVATAMKKGYKRREPLTQ